MPKRRTDLKPDKNGRYFRQLGWKMAADFTTRIQPEFYLGRVLEPAQVAYHRLGLLWDATLACTAAKRTRAYTLQSAAIPPQRF